MTTETTIEAPAENPAPATNEKPQQSGAPRKKQHVVIVTPLRHFRGIEDLPPQIGKALRELSGRPDARDYTWEFMAACGGLCSARNRVFHEALKAGADWVLPWDADLHDQHGREADAILHLLWRKQPVVAGIYCKRAKRPQWVATWMPAAKMQAAGLLQVAEVGGGFTLHSRRALTEVRRIFGEEALLDEKRKHASIMYRERETGEMIAGYFQIVVDHGDLLSEDYYLNALYRACKIPIFADTVVRLRQVEPDGKSYPEGAWPPIPAEDNP